MLNWMITTLLATTIGILPMGFIYTLIALVDGQAAHPDLVTFLQNNASGSIATVCLIVAVRYLIDERAVERKRKDDQIATVKSELHNSYKVIIDEYKQREKEKDARIAYLNDQVIELLQEGSNDKLQQRVQRRNQQTKAITDTSRRKELRISDKRPTDGMPD